MRYYLQFLFICAVFLFCAHTRAASAYSPEQAPPDFHAICKVSESRKYAVNSREQKWYDTEKALTSDVWAEFKYEQGDDFVTSVRAGVKREIRYQDSDTILFEIREKGQISTYAVNLALKEITGVQIGASNNGETAKIGARILQMSCKFQ